MNKVKLGKKIFMMEEVLFVEWLVLGFTPLLIDLTFVLMNKNWWKDFKGSLLHTLIGSTLIILLIFLAPD